MPLDLAAITDLALLVTLWATGIGVGVILPRGAGRRREDGAWMLLGIALNVIAIPIVAYVLCRLLSAPPDASAGVLLVASAAGGLLGLTTTRVVGGDMRRALVLVLVLEIANIVAIPFWTGLLLSTATAAPVVPVVRTVVLMLLLPLAVGFLARRARPDLAPRMARVCGSVSSVGLAVVVALVLVDAAPTIGATLRTGVAFVAFAMISGGMLAGAWLGGPGGAGRRAMAMVSAGHSGALALALSRSAFADRPEVEAAVVVVVGVIGVVLPVGAAVAVRARDRRLVAFRADTATGAGA